MKIRLLFCMVMLFALNFVPVASAESLHGSLQARSQSVRQVGPISSMAAIQVAPAAPVRRTFARRGFVFGVLFGIVVAGLLVRRRVVRRGIRRNRAA